MDKKLFIKELKNLFLNLNTPEKKYGEVWLSEIDFGGLYYSEKLILNVKMENHISSVFLEIKHILAILKEKLTTEKYNSIECVTVYNDNDRIWHERGDIILLEEAYLDAA